MGVTWQETIKGGGKYCSFIPTSQAQHEGDCFLISKEWDRMRPNGTTTTISRFHIGFENLIETLLIEQQLVIPSLRSF